MYCLLRVLPLVALASCTLNSCPKLFVEFLCAVRFASFKWQMCKPLWREWFVTLSWPLLQGVFKVRRTLSSVWERVRRRPLCNLQKFFWKILVLFGGKAWTKTTQAFWRTLPSPLPITLLCFQGLFPAAASVKTWFHRTFNSCFNNTALASCT